MKPGTRFTFSIFPLVLQGVATLSGIGVVSFFVPPVVSFLKKNEGKFVVPGPTRLLVENFGAAKLAMAALFAVSVITFLLTRSKMKEEVDRLAVQGAVYSVVWYAGIVFVGGVLMAGALPYFALNTQ